MSDEGPKPYPVVYDTINGLQYVFQSGAIGIATDNNAITALTGDITANGPGSVAVIVSKASGTFLVNGAVQTTTVSQEVIKQAASKLGLSITGTSIDGSNSTDGVGLYLLHNGSNNRQIGLVDSAATLSSEPAIRFVLNSTAPSIDVYTADLSSVGVVPLTLGNTTNGVIIQGPLIQNVVTVAGTGTVTPTAKQKIISVPVSGAVTLNGPTGGYDGQALTIRVVNDGSHSVALATGAGNYSFGTTITSYTNSASTIDYIGVIFNSSANLWHVVSLSQGF